MTDGLANKKITKRSGLVTGLPASGRDMSAAAARMPSFEFASAVPHQGSEGATVTPLPLPNTSGIHPAPNGVVRILVGLLVDSPFQPRLRYDEGKIAELAESLRYRQLEPLMVRPRDDGTYEIISGHRRKRAAPLAQLEELECRIVQVSDSEARVLVLAANEPREDFTDYERALAYKAILDDGMVGGEVRTQRQLAAKVGVDVSLVNRRLSMLELPAVVQEVLREQPAAFSSKWVKKLLELTAAESFDAERLKAALLRVSSGDIQMSAVFSVMATASALPAKQTPQRGLSLNLGNRLFAQVTPNADKRHVVVKLPGDCNIEEVADLILAAINKRFASKA